MGYLRHECLIVNHWDAERVAKAHQAALDIFGAITDGMGTQYATLVSPVIPHVANGGAAFFVAPDGSKEGWLPSELAEEAREALAATLDEIDVDWAIVEVGGDDDVFKVIKASG